MSDERPLIWTTKGNLPVDELTHEAAWDVQQDYIKFSERYRTADGEVVKESAHVYSRFGVTGEAVAATF